MTNEEYEAVLDTATAAARLLLMIGDKLDEARTDLSTIEAVAPILEPTAYQRGGMRRLDEQRRFLNAAIALRDVSKAILGEEVGS